MTKCGNVLAKKKMLVLTGQVPGAARSQYFRRGKHCRGMIRTYADLLLAERGRWFGGKGKEVNSRELLSKVQRIRPRSGWDVVWLSARRRASRVLAR